MKLEMDLNADKAEAKKRDDFLLGVMRCYPFMREQAALLRAMFEWSYEAKNRMEYVELRLYCAHAVVKSMGFLADTIANEALGGP
jgi:hypothetical protein